MTVWWGAYDPKATDLPLNPRRLRQWFNKRFAKTIEMERAAAVIESGRPDHEATIVHLNHWNSPIDLWVSDDFGGRNGASLTRRDRDTKAMALRIRGTSFAEIADRLKDVDSPQAAEQAVKRAELFFHERYSDEPEVNRENAIARVLEDRMQAVIMARGIDPTRPPADPRNSEPQLEMKDRILAARLAADLGDRVDKLMALDNPNRVDVRVLYNMADEDVAAALEAIQPISLASPEDIVMDGDDEGP